MNVIITPKEGEKELVSQIELIASKLGGKTEYRTTYNSLGVSSKKIIVEYNIKQKE